MALAATVSHYVDFTRADARRSTVKGPAPHLHGAIIRALRGPPRTAADLWETVTREDGSRVASAKCMRVVLYAMRNAGAQITATDGLYWARATPPPVQVPPLHYAKPGATLCPSLAAILRLLEEYRPMTLSTRDIAEELGLAGRRMTNVHASMRRIVGAGWLVERVGDGYRLAERGPAPPWSYRPTVHTKRRDA